MFGNKSAGCNCVILQTIKILFFMANLVDVKWLCQAGFIFETDAKRVVADPYMSDSCAPRFPRMVPVPVKFEDLKPDYVFFSHDHRDHFDEDSVAPIYKLYPKALFSGPVSTADHFKKMGCDSLKFQTLACGNSYSFDGFTLTPTVAYHSDPRAIGMIFKFGNKTVYLSGDTEYRPTLARDVMAAAGCKIDAAIICINGKLGNMNRDDAVKVVKEIKPDVAVPMHWGLFAGNTEDPKPFKTELENFGVRCIIPEPAAAFKL